MAPDENEYNQLIARLDGLTPGLVEDVLASYQANPRMVEQFGPALRGMAEQGVRAFRDVLIGALQFDVPGIVTHELSWLNRLLKARNLDGQMVLNFLQIFARRVSTSLTPEESAPILKLVETVQKQLQKQLTY